MVIQATPHIEQIVARMIAGRDVQAALILAPGAALPFAEMFGSIAADSFPVEVYRHADQALPRVIDLLSEQRPGPAIPP